MGKSFVLMAMSVVTLLTSGGSWAMADELGAEIVAHSSRKPSPLFAGSNSRAIFVGGALGAMINFAEGADLVKKHGLQDPQDRIAFDLANSLAARHGAVLASTPISTDGKRPKAMSAGAGSARYLVDVETVEWAFDAAMQFDLMYYSVRYGAKLKVIDVRNGKTVVAEKCRWVSPYDQRSKRGELLDNDAQRLKALFATGAAWCLARFETATAKLAPTLPPTTFAASLSTPNPLAERLIEAPPRVEAVPPPMAVAQSPIATIPPSTPGIGVKQASTGETTRGQPVPTAFPATTQIPAERPLPPYVEYPYARPNEAPPSRRQPPEARYAGRDANGFLVWPGKRL